MSREIIELLGRLAKINAAAAACFAAEHPKPYRRPFAGFTVMVENPAGSVRSGVDKDGHPWATQMLYDYGFISRAIGADGEGLDCYLGPNESADTAYVVHQNDPATGLYDEDKVMLGFSTPDEAKQAYLNQYDRPGFFRSMTILPLDQLREMLKTRRGNVKWKRNKAAAAAACFSAEGEGRWVTIGAQPETDETAIGEYLDGKRDVRASRVDAMLMALGLDPKKMRK